MQSHMSLVFLLLMLSGCSFFGASSSVSLTIRQKAEKCNEQFSKNIEDVLEQFPEFGKAYVMKFDIKSGQRPLSSGPIAMRKLIDKALVGKFKELSAQMKRHKGFESLEIVGNSLIQSLKDAIADYVDLDHRFDDEIEELSIEEFTNDAVFWAIFRKSNYIFTYFNYTVPALFRQLRKL